MRIKNYDKFKWLGSVVTEESNKRKKYIEASGVIGAAPWGVGRLA